MKAKGSDLIIISSDWENADLNMRERTAVLEGSPWWLREERDTYLVSLMSPGPVECQSFTWNGLHSGARGHLLHCSGAALAWPPFPKHSTRSLHICVYPLVSVSSPGNILLSTLSSGVFSARIPSLALRRESPLPCTHYFVVVVVDTSTMGSSPSSDCFTLLCADLPKDHKLLKEQGSS